jgi:hypothetical protein
MNIDIRALLDAGQAKLDADRAEQEKAKVGALRIGSSGIVTAKGEVKGTCHRITMARLLGKDKSVTRDTQIMWQGGEQLEEGFAKLLNLGHSGKVLRDKDISVDWTIPETTVRVLGRPDIVLADNDGKPLLGIEHKGVFGASTATAVWFERRPKNENLAQAAAYSMCLDVPFVLCYTSASWIGVNFFDQKKYGEKNIRPFYRLFYLEWRNETLFYRCDDQEEWTETEITKTAITDYFKLVAEMAEAKDLGPRLNGNYVDGTPNKWAGKDGNPYTECKFCSFSTACQDYEDKRISFDEWLSAAQNKRES